jgi:hypothetical protein
VTKGDRQRNPKIKGASEVKINSDVKRIVKSFVLFYNYNDDKKQLREFTHVR